MPHLPTLAFDAPGLPGGYRRYLGTCLLPIPALLYGLTMGEPGGLDVVAEGLRAGAHFIGERAGASAPGTRLVVVGVGSLLVPLLAVLFAALHESVIGVQVMLTWFAQTVASFGLYLLGTAPGGPNFPAHLRVEALAELGLLDQTLTVASACFVFGFAVFTVALLLPLRFGVIPQRRSTRSWITA